MPQALQLVFALLLLACSVTLHAESTETTSTAKNSPGERAGSVVLVLGDSLSAGYRIPLSNSWPALLQQSFNSAGADIAVENISISGETTAGGLTRLPGALQRWQPELLILALGGNDGLQGKPPSYIERNLASMIEHAQDSAASVLLVGMHIPPNFGPRYGEAFHAIYGKLAERHDTALLPFLLEGVATDSRLMQNDGIHPTVEAQALILDTVLRALRQLPHEDKALSGIAEAAERALRQ